MTTMLPVNSGNIFLATSLPTIRSTMGAQEIISLSIVEKMEPEEGEEDEVVVASKTKDGRGLVVEGFSGLKAPQLL